MEMESVVAGTPSLCAFFRSVSNLLRLALDARLHDVVSADGAVVDVDVPGPESDGVPFFDFKSFCYCSGFDHIAFVNAIKINYLFF